MALGSTLSQQYKPATSARPKSAIVGAAGAAALGAARGAAKPGTPLPVTYSNIPAGFTPPQGEMTYNENMPGIPNTNGTPNPFINQPTFDPGRAAAEQLAAQYLAQANAVWDNRTSAWKWDSGLANSLTGVNNQALRNATNNNLSLNQESAYRNSLDGQGNTLDAQFIRDTWGLANEQKTVDDANMQRLIGQANEGYGFANRQFDLANQATGLQEGINTRAAVSDASGRGATLSAGFMDNLGDIKAQADISRGRSALDQSQAFSSITGNIGDLYNRQASSDISYRNDVRGFQQQLDRNSFAKSAIDSMAREYGIRAKDMQQSLAAAIEKNNLNSAQVVSQLNQAYLSGNAQQIAQINQFLATLIGA